MKFSTGRVSRADAAEALACFSGANPRLDFDRAAACGARPAVAAGSP
ncbi:hypothetical protein ABZW32_06180 [Streptomyces sp. NPDC004667]